MLQPAGRRLRHTKIHPKIERRGGLEEHLVGDGRAVMERKRRGAAAMRLFIESRYNDVLRGREPPRPGPTACVAVVLEQTNMRATGQMIS